MTIELLNPFRPGEFIRADECWACDRPFKDDDDVQVVDAISPKIVHAARPCVDAMEKLSHDDIYPLGIAERTS